MYARIRDSILRDFGLLSRCFSTEELAGDADSVEDKSALIRALKRDERFVLFSPREEGIVIPERALFLWYINLLRRLSRAAISRLTITQFAGALSALRVQGQWDIPPVEATEYGCQLGLVASAPRGNDLVFPLARVLYVLPSSSASVMVCILKELEEKAERNAALRWPLEYWVKDGLSYFPELTSFVVQNREGLLGSSETTLDQLGRTLGVTRERVRQIEMCFWNKLLQRSTFRAPFMKGLLCKIIRQEGNLVFDSDRRTLKFLARCVGIPYAEIPRSELALLGMPQEAAKSFAGFTRPRSKLIDEESIMHALAQEAPYVSLAGAQIISRSILSFNREHLTKAQRVYLALRSIGKPAHYSDVTAAYNRLFPDIPSPKHNIHAILSREECGIVWIGIRGTFALREWGYEHPSKTLFKTIQEIVERIYAQTGSAVSLNLINAEIGKYRRVVRTSSVFIATHFNPRLRDVGGNSFVPEYARPGQKEELSADDLDRILDEFQPQGVR